MQVTPFCTATATFSRIVESKNEKFPEGKYILAKFGWRTHTVSTGKDDAAGPTGIVPTVLPDFEDLPLSLGLGVLGMPG